MASDKISSFVAAFVVGWVEMWVKGLGTQKISELDPVLQDFFFSLHHSPLLYVLLSFNLQIQLLN